MHPLKPHALGRSQSSPEFTTPREPTIRLEKPVWDDEIIDSYEASPNPVNSIKTASEYRTWLLKEAESWRATERVSHNPIETRRTFLTFARKSIAQSQMRDEQRTKALNVLKEAENVLDRP